MTTYTKEIAVSLAIAALLFVASCSGPSDSSKTAPVPEANAPAAEPPKNFQSHAAPVSKTSELHKELVEESKPATNSPLGNFDFRNFTYPLPRGWQNPDADEVTLVDGRLDPKFRDVAEDMSPEEKAAARAARRIGMSFFTARFMDANDDGQDDAVVILKVETGGNAVPLLVYIYSWKDGKPELIWNFRTGDRADGGLKKIWVENNELAVELFGQDRFLLGQTETGKITGDEEQLCCPNYFTRTRYKWNGKNFLMQGKRLTFSIEDPDRPPLENFGEIMNDPVKSKKYLRAK